MSIPHNPSEKSALDEAIDAVYADLGGHDSDHADYAKSMNQLSKLHELKMQEESAAREAANSAHKRELEARQLETEAANSAHTRELEDRQLEAETRRFKFGVNRDTLVIVTGNLIGIFAIVGRERMHIVTSRAFDFIKPTRKNT